VRGQSDLAVKCNQAHQETQISEDQIHSSNCDLGVTADSTDEDGDFDGTNNGQTPPTDEDGRARDEDDPQITNLYLFDPTTGKAIEDLSGISVNQATFFANITGVDPTTAYTYEVSLFNGA
jgi:hypothetical protein